MNMIPFTDIWDKLYIKWCKENLSCYGFVILFVLCSLDYKLAFCEDKISDSKIKGTLYLATLVVVELICHLYITAITMIIVFVSSQAGVSDNIEMFICSETFRSYRKNVTKNRIC
jgi:hypothetical protein